ncbi:MAG: glycosyltransferase family 9 protein [Bacteroidetes bacterium]|nr:glycosyltransferase family 9 protein [Bacteroidota bacterium]MBL6943635.1 glycosyltransferase family 9 protein [Bacteroidales bacterium]
MKKILIIQTASLGDVILSTPLIEKLHHFYPKAKIDFLLKYGYEGVLRRHPYLHHVIVWDKTEKKYHHLKELIEIIRNNKYDLVVNVHRFASSGLITALSGASIKVGYCKNPLSFFFTKRVVHKIGTLVSNPHESERNLKLIEDITDSSFFPVKLYPSQHDMAMVSQYKTKIYITVSPASLWFTKQFPEIKWVEFLTSLDEDIVVYMLGSPTEKALCDRLISSSNHQNNLNLAGKLTFLESTALMKDAVMNYVNDSAPMHMASAINASVAAIYCSTVPEFGFGPLSDNSHIIQTNEQLNCRPCGLHGLKRCPKKHFNCALTIKNEQLTKLVT